jgi:hypothetical protein
LEHRDEWEDPPSLIEFRRTGKKKIEAQGFVLP